MTPTIKWKPRDIKQIKIEGQEHDQVEKWKGKKRKEKKRKEKKRKEQERKEKSGGDQKKVKKNKYKQTAINRLFLFLCFGPHTLFH